jgi:membrane-associated phospholipid phosphatase
MKIVFIAAILLSGIILSLYIDIDLLREINLNRDHDLDVVFTWITNSAIILFWGVPVILLCRGILKREFIAVRDGIYVSLSVLTNELFTRFLKYLINRPRPFVTFPDIQNIVPVADPSFPSGHTSAAFAIATSISLTYKKWYIFVPAYIWAAVVGYSRMDLGVHYPTDVLCGAIIGTVCAYVWFSVSGKITRNLIKK